MKLASKLLAAPLLTALVVFSAGEIQVLLLNRSEAQSQASFDVQQRTYRSLAAAREQLALTHAGVYRRLTLIASLEEAQLKAQQAEMVTALAKVKTLLVEAAEAAATAHAAEGEQAADGAASPAGADLRQSALDAGALIDKYVKQVDSALDLATVDPNTGVASMQQGDASFNALAEQMRALVAKVDEQALAQRQGLELNASRIAWGLGLFSLLCAALAVGGSWLMQRALTAELRRAAELAGEVAAGNLAISANSERRDEVGDLIRALGAMAEQLGRSLRSVLASSDSIRTASSEIAHGNQDLSNRTEQTASKLQQAASSMDQLTGTVRQSADSAGEAKRMAASAAEVAARGGTVVSQVVATMEDINSSSRKISDIIGVIDSIAFQTNILALNAAVEAARAGEQGRGFAVVASEVRSLAQRSAQAAREIKVLIGDSVDKVEGGSRLVADAGRTMTEIVGSVQRVSDIIGEISAAAAAQSSGIGVVNASVVHLDQMTQQNAALVEQSAAAAESLREQAVSLAEVVHTFRLEGR